MHVLSDSDRKSLDIATTRFYNCMVKHFPPCEVQQIKTDGKWYMVLCLDRIASFAYRIEPGTYRTQMYKVVSGTYVPLFDNRPETLTRRLLTHKRMFEKLLEHMYLERLQNQ